jgi:hypothetical protein
VPETLLVPDQAPEATHEVAFVALHCSEEAPPDCTVLGLACSTTAAEAALTVTVVPCEAEPPAPVQVSSYSVVFERAPVDQVP